MNPFRAFASATIAAALAGTITLEIIELSTPDFAETPVHARATGAETRSPAASFDNRSTDLNAVLARPIFSPDRRPIAAAARTIAGLSRLTGIVVAGGRKVAIFAASGGGSPIVAEEGAHINAFKVTAITGSAVTVTGPDGETVVRPVFDASVQSAASFPVTPAGSAVHRKN